MRDLPILLLLGWYLLVLMDREADATAAALVPQWLSPDAVRKGDTRPFVGLRRNSPVLVTP